jgi:S1-C subfamily serine protease
MTSAGRSGFSRESRLLAATIGVSLVVLLVLSRFRFPDASTDARDGAAAQPLARLAARAAFDDLSLAVRELTSRVNGSLLAVRTSGQAGAAAATALSPTSRDSRLLPALRVRDDAAVVLVPEGTVVEGVIGVPGPVTILARDAVRGFALVRVPPQTAPMLSIREGQQPLPAPGYLAVAEATGAGTSVRPVFVGRSDGVGDPRWDTPLLTLGRGAAADIGAPVFTLDGRFAGMVTATDGEPALIPADVVLASVDQLLRGAVTTTGDIGVATQPLDQALARATGASFGAVVAAVDTESPAAQTIAPGDVITAVNGQTIRSPDALRLRVSRTAPGTSLTLTLRREGAFLSVPVTVRARPTAEMPPAAAAPASSAQVERALGLTLRSVAGTGSEVLRVQAGSIAEACGLRAGDLVVGLGRARTPAPDDITAAFTKLPAGGALFLSVERNGEPHLVALQR